MNLLTSKIHRTFGRLFAFFFGAIICFASQEVVAQWALPVAPGTVIRGSHITELRTEINARLGLCGQPSQVWSRATLTPKSTSIKKIDMEELRTATKNLVNAYRAQQGFPALPPVFQNDPILIRSTPIRAVHITELRGYVGGAACTTNCPAQNLSWIVGGKSCSGTYASTANGASATAPNTTAGFTGMATFQCLAGAWAGAPNAGATCTPSPNSCPAATLSWTVAGNTCSGNYPSTTDGSMALASNTNSGLTGSAGFKCTLGAWAGAPVAGATCATSLDCVLKLPLGWDNGAFPLVKCYSLPLTFQNIALPNGSSHTETGYWTAPRCGEITIKCVNGVLVTTAKQCDAGFCP